MSALLIERPSERLHRLEQEGFQMPAVGAAAAAASSGGWMMVYHVAYDELNEIESGDWKVAVEAAGGDWNDDNWTFTILNTRLRDVYSYFIFCFDFENTDEGFEEWQEEHISDSAPI